jgi:hypothetical protein
MCNVRIRDNDRLPRDRIRDNDRLPGGAEE